VSDKAGIFTFSQKNGVMTPKRHGRFRLRCHPRLTPLVRRTRSGQDQSAVKCLERPAVSSCRITGARSRFDLREENAAPTGLGRVMMEEILQPLRKR